MRSLCAFPFAAVLSFALISCAPTHLTRTVDARPGLAFSNVGKDAVLSIDNIEYGDPSIYDGKHATLRLEPGVHHVQIQQGGTVIFSEEVFLGGGEIRNISLTGTKKGA